MSAPPLIRLFASLAMGLLAGLLACKKLAATTKTIDSSDLSARCVKADHVLLDLGSGSSKFQFVRKTRCGSRTTFTACHRYHIPFNTVQAIDKTDNNFPASFISDATGKIAISITENTKRSLDKCESFNPVSLAGVATEAFRRAGNGSASVDGIAKSLSERLNFQVTLRLISQPEEAAMPAKTLARLFHRHAPFCILDIGGGSAQLVRVDSLNTFSMVASSQFGSEPHLEFKRSMKPASLRSDQTLAELRRRLLTSEEPPQRPCGSLLTFGIGGMLGTSVARYNAYFENRSPFRSKTYEDYQFDDRSEFEVASKSFRVARTKIARWVNELERMPAPKRELVFESAGTKQAFFNRVLPDLQLVSAYMHESAWNIDHVLPIELDATDSILHEIAN